MKANYLRCTGFNGTTLGPRATGPHPREPAPAARKAGQRPARDAWPLAARSARDGACLMGANGNDPCSAGGLGKAQA